MGRRGARAITDVRKRSREHVDVSPGQRALEFAARNAAAVKDPNFRVQVSSEGIHVYNRDGLSSHTDPFELFPRLGLDGDGGHAFYMGVELARAEIAWQLGKRYVQDRPLDWGCAFEHAEEDLLRHRAPGTTMRRQRRATDTEDSKANAQDT